MFFSSKALRSVFCILLTWTCARAAPVPAPPDPAVTKMLDLFQRLQAAQRNPAAPPVRFQFAESEVNTYLIHALSVTPRPGLRSVKVKFFAKNYVSTLVTVDFDAVKRWNPGLIPLPLRPILTGTRAIWVDVRFGAWDRKATFSVEKAYFDKLRLPAFLVEKVIQVVAARQPEHYDTSKPVPLPFGLYTVYTNERAVAGGTVR